MKYYLNLLFSISIFLLPWATTIAQHSILGDSEACYSDCKTYTLSGGIGGPYYWKTTGEIEGSNQGNQVNICWNTIGSNEIRLTDFSAPVASQTQSISVQVYAYPSPEILPPKYPSCTIRDSIIDGSQGELEPFECQTACSGSIAFYGFEENNGATSTWEVEGGTILSTEPDGISIQWDVSGAGTIKLIETNAQGCSDSTRLCIEILNPLDINIFALNGGPNSISVCAGQEVYLQANSSEDITQFEWQLRDGSYTYGSNATVSYTQGGVYDVMLIGATECKCFDTSYYQIIVDSNPGPEITCVGTTCGTEEHTYYAANSCGTYNWNISPNGTITDGGSPADDYVTIDWTSGPVGTVGLSTSGCTEALCADETVVQIPIIDGSASIQGPTQACKSGFSQYTIQDYNGTEYTWSISGNGSIIDGWGTHEITVAWDNSATAPNDAVISVEYENCYLECGGQANLNVTLKPEFDISLPSLLCQDRNAYLYAFTGWTNADVTWTITSPSGVITSYANTSSVNEIFPEPGLYTVIVEDSANDYCNELKTAFFEVVDKPVTPTQINGPLVICKNEYYNYSVSLPESGISAQWYINDGTILTQYQSNTAFIQWTSNGPYRIRVSYFREDVFCRSEELEVTLQLAENASITGSSSTCVDQIETYGIGATNGTTPEWSLSPSDAGSVLHNADNTLDVMWHVPGNHEIVADYCGASISYAVSVESGGVSTITYDDKVCPGDLSTIISTIPAGSIISIKDEDEVEVGNSVNQTVSPGTYEVEITSASGCVEVIPVAIDTFLPPSLRISSPDENAFCNPHPEVSIVALNTEEGYTYEWFRDNLAIGETGSSISTNVYGSYHVEVTDVNGCTAISNTHTLYEWCGGDPPGGSCPGGGAGVIDIAELSLQCNVKQFTVGGLGYSSTSFNWDFGDPDSGADNSASGTTVIHEFSNAGHYYVFVFGNTPGEYGVDIFTVPAAPRFDYDEACIGEAIQFTNHSTFLPGFSIVNYNWNFGDPASGTDNISADENPQHIYSSPGIYTVILEIEGSDGCLASFSLNVEVGAGPLAEFLLPTSACSNDGILFEAFEDEDIYLYEWDFDDPSSGASNSSNNQDAIHTFSSSGTYNVSLQVTDNNNCVQSILKSIDITTNSLSGDIVADKAFPVCFGEEVTLQAPGGGTAYIWSDGSTGPSITVTEPGIYNVTVTENTGCDYTPEPINVVQQGRSKTKITATHLTSSFFGPRYFDSLEICQGELFTLSIPWQNGASIEWSNGNTSTYINEVDLAGLSPGRHDYRVTITDPTNGCQIESDPMAIIIHALPDPITISSNMSDPCEGQQQTLSVDNVDPTLSYYWSNGARGTSTTVNKSDIYSVTAINKNGCETKSPGIFVAPVPNANRINLGCMEACFPDTICIPGISGANSFQWLLDGSPIAGPVGTSQDLIAEQAGEYQLIVESFYGCMDTSAILSIEAAPSDQSASGVVFIDDNNNGVWDTGEELLAGVTVNLMFGNMIEATVLTDASGYYIFDPIIISNPSIQIDTTGLGLSITGGLLQDDLDFALCTEDKEKDFPLLRECSPTVQTLNFQTCPGESIMINNIELQEGDTWTFTEQSTAGCDSSTLVYVNAFPVADIVLSPIASCEDINNGSLVITIMSGTGLQFALDNSSNYTNDLQFDGLSPGMHMLTVIDANSCLQNFSFEIPEVMQPSMLVLTQNTCPNDNTGQIDIMAGTLGNYQYSLDGINFSANPIFENLGVSSGFVFVLDDYGCVHSYPYAIAPNPQPMFDLATTSSCSGGDSGSLSVTPLHMGSYQYSLDNITFTTTATFAGLPPGTGTLYVMEDDGCTHSYTYEILESLSPEVAIVPSLTCAGENLGTLSITPVTNGDYTYSLDGITYTDQVFFDNLSEGAYTVYLLEDGICAFQYPTYIDIQPLPTVDFLTSEACMGESNGSIEVLTSETGLQYALDQVNFSNDEILSDLPAGMHTVYVLGQNDCIHSFEVEIEEAGELVVEFTEVETDCSMDQVSIAPAVIESFGEVSYLWSEGTTDSTLTVTNSGLYAITVSDECSMTTYEWNIEIEEENKEQPIHFPNIFSPNQDGVNECFVPVLNPEAELINYRLVIFDRWGNKYFETADINDCWDGMYNGREVRTGVFVYLLEMDYTYCVEEKNYKKSGDVTVVH